MWKERTSNFVEGADFEYPLDGLIVEGKDGTGN